VSPLSADAVTLSLGFRCLSPDTASGPFVNQTQLTALPHNPMGDVQGMVRVAQGALANSLLATNGGLGLGNPKTSPNPLLRHF
jgi:hypothetical protein